MPYCNHSRKHCNKDNTHNKKHSYNDIKEMIIGETDINRLRNNGHWDNIIRKSSFN